MEESAVLSVSTSKLSFNCKNVATTLKECGVQCKITKNDSIVEKNSRLFHEIGCTIELFNFDNKNLKDKVWEPLKNEYTLDCCHLSIKDKYNGCIYDYLNDKKNSCMKKNNIRLY